MLHRAEASKQSPSRDLVITIYDFIRKNIKNPRVKGNINNLSMHFIPCSAVGWLMVNKVF
jgi:hypothetical protein